ncbi:MULTISPECIES: ABC transporter substrate-binding protein [Streptomyces]|uniref:ABC transporter n=1 Tax=Streptomyces bottropensis ATCC 25435 TaxID=1054862 RepID=M3E5H6_9ACTN|nr:MULTISPECIES: ABC transporter substrate-binding protein [Streptomyces]EMF51291.1 ABC transporter [Streptomyces bottropensis ATCC 25435]MZD20644.1 ABC transporter substrate-binding protein [Streptomyces sp. SID5476]
MTSFSRRRILGGAGAALGATALGTSITSSAAAATRDTTSSAFRAGRHMREEKKSLDELYADARREGGELVIYAGGDLPDQQDATKQAFVSQFPDIKLTMVVDYSKYQDVRIDNQLATDTLVPDVVQLQTVQDFARWKAMGVLQRYKPAGFSALYPQFRDPDGAWVSIAVFAFSYMYDQTLGSDGPATPRDLADPRWKGAISSTYPHDDDAVLYLYKLYTEAYGWDWIRRLAAQNVEFGRGSFTPIVSVASGQKRVGIGGVGSLTGPIAPGVKWAAPDGHPFMAWGQRAAILARAKHPAAAKLYLNWQLSRAVQEQSFDGWSVRTDVTPAGGLKPIWKYPNAHLDGFPRFMADRAEVERWKQTFALYFGEVHGAPTPGSLGLHPGQ